MSKKSLNKKNTLLCFLFCLNIPLLFASQANLHIDIAEALTKGHTEIKNPFLTRRFYKAFYQAFDTCLKEPLMSQITALSHRFYQENPHIQAQFCKAPAGFKSRRKKGRIYHQDDKIYFQYTSPFHAYLQKNHPDLLKANPHFKHLLDLLQKITSASQILFDHALIGLEKRVPGISSAFKGPQGQIPIVIKAIKYCPTQNAYRTLTHHDKSGLTLILDNSDLSLRETLQFAPYGASSCPFPTRLFNTMKCAYSSTLLIFGACLKKKGIPIEPTPHCVLCWNAQKPRFSLIAFALIPYLDTQDLPTVLEQ